MTFMEMYIALSMFNLLALVLIGYVIIYHENEIITSGQIVLFLTLATTPLVNIGIALSIVLGTIIISLAHYKDSR